ncbi:MAG: hypothetical protein V1888_04370 [archaeon]
MVVGFASAGALTSNVIVEFNGEIIGLNDNLASFAGDVVPVKVTFTAESNASDVKIEVGMYDGRDDTDDSTGRFNVVAGKRYTKLLSLKLPSDFDDEFDDMTLSVEIYDADHDTDDYNEDYRVSMQRESYELDILSVDYKSRVTSGAIVPVSIVIENNGYNFAEDNFVMVSIPALGVSARGYVGDLDSMEDYNNDNHEDNAVQKTVYLEIPADVKSDVYEMEVTVYNEDAKTVTGNLIAIDGVEVEKDAEVLDGEVVKESVSASVVALTVILVIVFVVLLAVLVVLLTKKEKVIEEVETSYY